MLQVRMEEMESKLQKGNLVVAAMQSSSSSQVFQPADAVVKHFLVFKRVAVLSVFVCKCSKALYLSMLELRCTFGLDSVLLACLISLSTVRLDSF